MSRDLDATLAIAREIARQAAEKVSEVYRHYLAGGDAGTVQKEGDGPVTAADRAANEVILAELAKHFPTDAVLTEEDKASWITSGEWTWMIDPLDGTEDFIKGNGEFAVMIGLCHNGVPVLGVVREPAFGDELFAVKGQGAWRVPAGKTEAERIHVSQVQEVSEMTLAVSRSHRPARIEFFCKELNLTKEISSGSVGRKISLVTTGRADVYLHPSPGTKLWDTCGPQVILEEAGGKFTTALGEPIQYSRKDGDVKNDDGILASSPWVSDQLVAVARKACEIPLPPRPPKKK